MYSIQLHAIRDPVVPAELHRALLGQQRRRGNWEKQSLQRRREARHLGLVRLIFLKGCAPAEAAGAGDLAGFKASSRREDLGSCHTAPRGDMMLSSQCEGS